MISRLIKEYQALDKNAQNIINALAAVPCALEIEYLLMYMQQSDKYQPRNKLEEVLRKAKSAGIVYQNTFSRRYTIDTNLRVWLYPLIKDRINLSMQLGSYLYSGERFDHLYAYLSSLFSQNKEVIKVCEEKLIKSESFNLNYLQVLLLQPDYEPVYPYLSDYIIGLLYENMSADIFVNLDDLGIMSPINEKLQNYQSSKLHTMQAEITFKKGLFSQISNTKTGRKGDAPISYFGKATVALLANKQQKAMELFEQGLKKQRRDYQVTHLPLLPEAALFYLAMWLSEEQSIYLPILERIVEKKSKYYDTTLQILVKACMYFTTDPEHSRQIVASMQDLGYISQQVDLWKIITLGLLGEELNAKDLKKAEAVILKAYNNGYRTAAYEASYVFLQWQTSAAVQRVYDMLSYDLKYPPALSMVRRVELWEKQLNAYMSLESVKSVLRQEADNGKTRIAYRFYPDKITAMPIMQSRQADGGWYARRNISVATFMDKKVEHMTEQDRLIASSSHDLYVLGPAAIYAMAGHPHVYLEDTDIPVELIQAEPVLSIVKLPDGDYKLECDVVDTRTSIVMIKETNTRYKLYHLTAPQREIINAISKGSKIPEKGLERLHQVLKHFSVHLNIQSDEVIADNKDSEARQVEPDSRIRVQLLPFGNGFKAELFVKPFGNHPPYCKPGRGGKSLLANENGERLRLIRNMEQETQNNESLMNEIQAIESLNTTNGLMSFDNPLDSLDLLDILNRHQDIAVVEWPEGERLKLRKTVRFSDINLRVRGNVSSWFELEGEVKIDENNVMSISALLDLMKHAHGRFIELAGGEFFALSEQLRRSLAELSAFSTDTKDGLKINRFASASLFDVFDDFEHLQIDKAWEDFRKRLETVKLQDTPVPAKLKTELRPYQEAGYQWMMRLAGWGAGACLADDMGLGKTVQTIAVLLQRASEGPALVVCPVSVAPNWISEIRKFAPSLAIKTLLYGDRAGTVASLEAGDVLITSYGLLLSEEATLTSLTWNTIVLDEAHAIKNHATKTSQAAMNLQSAFRIILTGTPVQNHLGEVWNLFNFINPGLLGSLNYFTETFIKPGEEAHKSLKKLLSPFILRRTKNKVLDELPPKTEIIRKIELNDDERAFYEVIRRQAIETLENDDSAQGAKHLKTLAEITRLRQACCNPALVEPQINIESSKLSTFLEIAAELKDNGHQALVFSQFVTHLEIVRKAVEEAGFSYQYLDGSTSNIKRQAAVHNFQKGESDLFLISLKAGGLGLNLTAADFVIHLDPWWNPAIEDQASDRAYRIGQTRPVTVYRLVAEHTIEEKIIQLHNTKRDLADSLLEGSDQSSRLSLSELLTLIQEE
jgi:SNF2 family DNA or RNA helicase